MKPTASWAVDLIFLLLSSKPLFTSHSEDKCNQSLHWRKDNDMTDQIFMSIHRCYGIQCSYAQSIVTIIAISFLDSITSYPTLFALFDKSVWPKMGQIAIIYTLNEVVNEF